MPSGAANCSCRFEFVERCWISLRPVVVLPHLSRNFTACTTPLRCGFVFWTALGFSLLVRFASFRVSYRMIIAFAIGGRSSATVGLFTHLSRVRCPWRAPHNEVESRHPCAR
jgi:hypothetical protein